MNAINRRVSRLELQLAADNVPRDEHGWTAAEAIWEAQCRGLTKEELILEKRKMAISHEACRGHRTIAEAIWRGQAALKNFAKLQAGQE